MKRKREDPEKRRKMPSRMAKNTGYRTDSERHKEARMKVPKKRRVEIAKAGGEGFLRKISTEAAKQLMSKADAVLMAEALFDRFDDRLALKLQVAGLLLDVQADTIENVDKLTRNSHTDWISRRHFARISRNHAEDVRRGKVA
jgi:hypothetical protein